MAVNRPELISIGTEIETVDYRPQTLDLRLQGRKAKDHKRMKTGPITDEWALGIQGRRRNYENPSKDWFSCKEESGV